LDLVAQSGTTFGLSFLVLPYITFAGVHRLKGRFKELFYQVA
jgi:hypothetical protein